MKPYLFCLLLTASCLLPPATGQWGGGRCRGQTPVGVVQARKVAQSFTWLQTPSAPDQVQLLRNGKQIGTWRYDLGMYYPMISPEEWAESPEALPAGCPPPPEAAGSRQEAGGSRQQAAVSPETSANFGVDVDKLAAAGSEKYTVNGLPATRTEAAAAIEGDGRLPDDAGRLRLTVIGDETARKQVLADLAGAAELAPFKDKLLVQSYPPAHWAVAGAGFQSSGKPTIYLQAPSGKVLHRQDDYSDGAKGLAEAIRKADPNYAPDKDPDKRKADPLPSLPDLGQIPEWVWLVAAGGALLLFGRRK
jgi:hypothetical protein